MKRVPRPLSYFASPDRARRCWSWRSSDRTDGKGGHDIWTARRPSAAADGAPTNLAEVNTVDDELEPAISADGRELYLYRFRPADDTSLLLRATRASPTMSFSSPVPLPIFGSSFVDTTGPWVSTDGLQLYLTVQTAKAAPVELAVARRPTLGDGFTLVRLLSEVNGPATDGWPTLSSDERELFYETDREGKGRIYTARRDDRGQLFSNPKPVVELNGNFACGDPDLSRDGRTIYFLRVGGPQGPRSLDGHPGLPAAGKQSQVHSYCCC